MKVMSDRSLRSRLWLCLWSKLIGRSLCLWVISEVLWASWCYSWCHCHALSRVESVWSTLIVVTLLKTWLLPILTWCWIPTTLRVVKAIITWLTSISIEHWSIMALHADINSRLNVLVHDVVLDRWFLHYRGIWKCFLLIDFLLHLFTWII